MGLRIGTLELGLTPRLAAPVSDAELEPAGSRLRALADVVELRVDQFARHDPAYVLAVGERARALGRPLIATVRAVGEGGVAALDDEHRWALYDVLAPLVDGLDVELHAAIRDRVVALAKRQHKLAIVSYHDFAATPVDSDLAALAGTARKQGADIVKIAAYAAAAGDVERLLDCLRAQRGSGAIVIAMGLRGAASRVFFPLMGSLITYGFLAQANAPGQLQLEDLYDELRRYSPEFAAARPPRTSR